MEPAPGVLLFNDPDQLDGNLQLRIENKTQDWVLPEMLTLLEQFERSNPSTT
jgi:hypothetical protein